MTPADAREQTCPECGGDGRVYPKGLAHHKVECRACDGSGRSPVPVCQEERPDVGLICKACGHWPVEATAEPSAVTTDERLSVVYDEQAESRRLRASLSGLPVAPKEEGEADA